MNTKQLSPAPDTGPHYCIQCSRPIAPGAPYILWPPAYYRQLINVRYHPDCFPERIRAAQRRLLELLERP